MLIAAVLAVVVTLVLGVWENLALVSQLQKGDTRGFDAAAARQRELLRWLYLSGSSFLVTVACAGAFELARCIRRRWLRRGAFLALVPITVVVLTIGAAVAYIPERAFFEQGWIVQIPPLARWVTLLAGILGLLFGAAVRRRRAGA